MSVLLHDRPKAMLARLTAGRLGSYIFFGPPQVGKAAAARDLARQLACPDHHADSVAACPVCRAFTADAYPDFHYLAPTDRPTIAIEQVRRLTTALADRAYRPRSVRSVLIDDAQALTVDAQNALLKLIEEPPAGALIVLVTSEPQGLLATIRSRCIAVYFPAPSQTAVIKLVAERYPELTSAAIEQLVARAENLPGRALALAASPELMAADRELHAAAVAVLGQSLFERLLLGARLAAGNQADLLQFARYLQALLSTRITTGAAPAAAAPGFAALVRFRKRLAAGVTSRVAIETLMLELTG